jgi:Uncharacterised nucleotidyltransferase
MYKRLDELGGCWPTHLQELLLKAALFRGDAALSAYKEWISSVDIENLDWGSYRLLPLLYHNLNGLGINDPVMKKLKGVYRYTWFKNKMLFAEMSRLLQLFSEAGIKTMALKGPALVLVHYRDCGLRPMDDFDVLVPTERATDAIDLLRKNGFVPFKEDSPETILSKRHSTPFRSASQLNMDLHWHLFEDPVSEHDDSDFWNAAVPIMVNGVASCALNPTDQLFHAFVHGIRWNSAPPFRWIADMMTVLKTSENKIDWNRLLTKAREHRVVLTVESGVSYMQKTMGISVPQDVLQGLRDTPVSRREAVLYDVQTRPYNKFGMNRLLYLRELYRKYLHTEVGEGLKNKLLSFPDFLKKFWKIDSYWKIPVCAISKSFGRISQMARYEKTGK